MAQALRFVGCPPESKGFLYLSSPLFHDQLLAGDAIPAPRHLGQAIHADGLTNMGNSPSNAEKEQLINLAPPLAPRFKAEPV